MFQGGVDQTVAMVFYNIFGFPCLKLGWSIPKDKKLGLSIGMLFCRGAQALIVDLDEFGSAARGTGTVRGRARYPSFDVCG